MYIFSSLNMTKSEEDPFKVQKRYGVTEEK